MVVDAVVTKLKGMAPIIVYLKYECSILCAAVPELHIYFPANVGVRQMSILFSMFMPGRTGEVC